MKTLEENTVYWSRHPNHIYEDRFEEDPLLKYFLAESNGETPKEKSSFLRSM